MKIIDASIAIISLVAVLSPFVFLQFRFFKALAGGLYWEAKLVAACWFAIAFYLFASLGMVLGRSKDDCCLTSPMLAHEHALIIALVLAIYVLAWIVLSVRKQLFSPVVEVVLGSSVVGGLVVIILLLIHYIGLPTRWDEHIFRILYFVLVACAVQATLLLLLHNYKVLRCSLTERKIALHGALGRIIGSVVAADFWEQQFYLLVLFVPLLFMMILIVMLFGQRPDAIIRAFTDTYGYTFSSQHCDYFTCHEHFLCTIGAHGHEKIVRPVRNGVRQGTVIRCTRQLLIANAFEALLAEKLPRPHRVLRANYNRVGAWTRHHKTVFANRWVCDAVYLVMKPAEWCFLLVLYTWDVRPEDRINMQYLSASDRGALEQRLLSRASGNI